jgi:thiol-disulfide isomerase/thioredoxin
VSDTTGCEPVAHSQYPSFVRTSEDVDGAPSADSPAVGGQRGLRRIDLATVTVVSALVALGVAWLVWARLTASPDGVSWGPLDSILRARASRYVSQPAPSFILADPSGYAVSLDELRGQVVLVNFWATWCDPCRAEMPELDELAREYGPQGFRVVAVNVLEDAGRVQRFRDELGLDMPLLLDPGGVVYGAFGVEGMPSSYLVDRDGIIRDVRLGVVTRRYLESRLPALLGG